HGRRAHAVAALVVEVTAGAGVHGRGQHEARGEAERHCGARNGDLTVLKRLAENLEDVARELGKLVQEEEAVVREADLAGTRDHAATDEAGVGDGVVRCAEGTLRDQTFVLVEDAGDGVNLGGLERLFEAQRREDRGQALGEHRLAGTWRADHEDVVPARRCDLERALGNVLSAYVAKVGEVIERPFKEGARFYAQRLGFDRAVRCGVEQFADFEQTTDRIDAHAVDDGGLACVGRGDDEVADASVFGGDGDGQHALHGADAAVQAKLADQDEVAEVADGERVVGAEDAGGDGEIEAGALFLEVGGCEVDGDARGRNVEAAVLDGGADAVAAFADGSVGQTDDTEALLLFYGAEEVYFYVDQVRVDPVDRRAARLEKHVPPA